MYTLAVKHNNGFEKIVLSSDTTDAQIIPACGAMLHAFTAKDENHFINIIDSYADKNEFDYAAEMNGFKGLKLSPFPCRIQNATYHFNDKQFYLKRLKHNNAAMHGLLYNKPFDIIHQYSNDDECGVTLLHNYTGHDAGYPFAYTCKVIYTLHTQNCLSIKTIIQNTGNTSLPIADGWHPYFTFHKKVDELQLQFNSTAMLEFINLIPTGKTIQHNDFIEATYIGDKQMDNSFVLDFNAAQPMCILKDVVSCRQLEIFPAQSYPYLQIYIPPHRNSIAIENLSAPPDCFNNKIGLIELLPGASADFSTMYCLKKI
jgi:aldose 1-epimerase